MNDALAGKRILIVEDEYFIATDLKRMLSAAGAVVIGPVGKLKAGLALVEGVSIDAAVLDANLEEALSYPIADRLAERGVPYLFLTGYDGWSLPPQYRSAPRLAKPFPAQAVLAGLEKLCMERVT